MELLILRINKKYLRIPYQLPNNLRAKIVGDIKTFPYKTIIGAYFNRIINIQ